MMRAWAALGATGPASRAVATSGVPTSPSVAHGPPLLADRLRRLVDLPGELEGEDRRRCGAGGAVDLGETDARRPSDLTVAGFAAELADQLVDLPET
jgi:hypothetical protein